MTMISEMIKYYEAIESDPDFDDYFGETDIYKKVEFLKLMRKAVGDVSLPDGYLKAFMYCFCKYTP